MNVSKLSPLLSVAIWFCALGVSGRTVTDTLRMAGGGDIIVTYSLSRADDRYTLKFDTPPRKRLAGSSLERKYGGKLEELAVVFFDRQLNKYGRDIDPRNVSPAAFRIPAAVGYTPSADGVFVVEEGPSLVFDASGASEIVIPLFLAYHPKKKYTLLARTEGLCVRLDPAKVVVKRRDVSSRVQGAMPKVEIEPSVIEIETDNSAQFKVLECANRASQLLAEAKTLPFSGTLEAEIDYLRQQKREVMDPDLLRRIDEVLEQYSQKERSLRDASDAEADSLAAAKALEEERQRKEAEEKAAQQAEEEKTRNLWMLIGGGVLAVLAFFGNMLFQAFRDRKNRHDIEKMQQRISHQAQTEADRQAKTAKAEAERKARKAEREAAGKRPTSIMIKGKNKDLSI